MIETKILAVKCERLRQLGVGGITLSEALIEFKPYPIELPGGELDCVAHTPSRIMCPKYNSETNQCTGTGSNETDSSCIYTHWKRL